MKKLEVMREARNLKKIAKLGAVPMKDFEALKQDVQLQRVGFLALAGIEVIRLAKPKKGISKKDIDKIADGLKKKKKVLSILGELSATQEDKNMQNPKPKPFSRDDD